MMVRTMEDGSVEIVETAAEINDKYVAAGLQPPIVAFSGGPIDEGAAILTRMTAEEPKQKGDGMPDFERLIDDMRIKLATSALSREWASGYAAGKAVARWEAAIVAVVFIVALALAKALMVE